MSPLELLETQVIEYDLPRPIPHTVVSDCTIFEMLGSELGASYILGKYSFTEVVPGLFYYFILFFYMRVCVYTWFYRSEENLGYHFSGSIFCFRQGCSLVWTLTT